MTNEYFQCCYTNAEVNLGGTVSSGWQAVAVSPGIPSDVLGTCTKLQNVNSTIQGAMTDEQGNVLDLYELYGDGAYVYAIRSKYGLLDRLGRANMFSHALIFDFQKSGSITDPNVFLGLSSENFKRSQEEAEALKPPLARETPLDIDAAMAKAGISHESYLALVRCVYAKMTERGFSKPLYVQYDGTDDHMRSILYCIYWGIPYFLRKRLSVASAPSNGAETKTLVFSVNATSKPFYIDPRTGQSNVLNKRLERKINRYGFADYAVIHLYDLDEDAYFEQLEQTAMELGDQTASDPLVLKIAHTLIVQPDVSDLDDATLEERLSDVLRSRPLGSERMDAYIVALMNEIVRRNMVLTEESEAYLADKVAATKLDELESIDEQYRIQRFSALPVEDAAQSLARLDKSMRARYRNRLKQTQKGAQILDCYYADIVLPSHEPSWELANKGLDAVSELPYCERMASRVDDMANGLYGDALKDISTIVPNFESYMLLMKRLYGESNPEMVPIRRKDALRAYWNCVDIATFDFNALQTYLDMADESQRCKMITDIAYLGRKLDGAISEEDFFGDTFEFFQRNESSFAAEPLGAEGMSERELAIEKLCAYAKECYTGDDRYFADWLKIAANAKSADMLSVVAEVRRTLYEGDANELVQCYGELHRHWGIGATKETVVEVAELVCACSIERERHDQEYVTPIDVWLIVGGDLCSRSTFEIFDEFNDLRVLMLDDPTEAVLHSKLLQKESYVASAKQYVSSRDIGTRETKGIVREWLAILRPKKKKGGGFGFGQRRREAEVDAPLPSAQTQDQEQEAPQQRGRDDEPATPRKNEPKQKKGIFSRVSRVFGGGR